MSKLNNVIGTPVNRDANGFVSVVDEDKKGNHAVPVTLVTKDGEGIFDYLKSLGGGGGGADPEELEGIKKQLEALGSDIKEVELHLPTIEKLATETAKDFKSHEEQNVTEINNVKGSIKDVEDRASDTMDKLESLKTDVGRNTLGIEKALKDILEVQESVKADKEAMDLALRQIDTRLKALEEV